ncbi:hypothetical protein NEFER03_1916 [Nematocida sp. LUAm3]|nr:hypothetical protein NEFER03_1916 [Nematocida sp. LUAm3]KAI5176182.1 hypothetical protein NEFER02_1996 [Nematocida sp. LUAm2]KAI5179276.1 hypothetical protein NEFER01_2128 [Nematocida sp. LUAm1]
MQKITNNKVLSGIAILAMSFLLMLDLSQATVQVSEEDRKDASTSAEGMNTQPSLTIHNSIMPEEIVSDSAALNSTALDSDEEPTKCFNMFKTRSTNSSPSQVVDLQAFTLNAFSKRNPSTDFNYKYPLTISSCFEFRREWKKLSDKYNVITHGKYVNSYRLNMVKDEQGELQYIMNLADLFDSMLKGERDQYSFNIFNKLRLDYIITSYPTQCLTGKQAALYVYHFLGVFKEYIENLQGYTQVLRAVRYNNVKKLFKDVSATITSAKCLLNTILVYSEFNPLDSVIELQTILDDVKLNRAERKKLIQYSEFIIYCIHSDKNYNFFCHPSTQARLKKTEKDISNNCSLIKNYESIECLYDALFSNAEYIDAFKKWIFKDYCPSMFLDENCLKQHNDGSSYSSEPPTVVNTISPENQIKYIDMSIMDIVIFCGTNSIIEISIPPAQEHLLVYKSFKKILEKILLNPKTKVIFKPYDPFPTFISY